MADNTVMQTLYSKEFVIAYEQKQSFLRGTVSTEGEIKGNQFVFIIEGIADEAVTRGANGNIPYAADNQSSATCTLAEYHHLARKNNFNIFASSVPQRLSMQRRGVTSINNKTDKLILTQLATTTYSAMGGAAQAGMTINPVLDAIAMLDAASVPDDGERYGLLTPRAWAWLMKVNQFASGDWVSDKPFMKRVQWRDWSGVKWCRHPNLTGVGTATATCVVYHKAAVGHGLNMGEMVTKVGNNDEQDYSWARTSAYQGAKALQLPGIVKIVHNDTTALS
jgi:hypothetical protein